MSAPQAPGGALFAAGIAFGVIVGAGAALLLAPGSGEETRHAIARRSRRLTRKGRDAWDDLRDELQHALEQRKRVRARRRRQRELAADF